MKKNDRVRFQHMIDTCEEIMEYTATHQFEDLHKNRMLVHSLVRCIEVIGEAASKVSEEMRIHHPSLPWDEMRGMRNRLIHAYFDVNRFILWNTATEKIPLLLADLKELLQHKE